MPQKFIRIALPLLIFAFISRVQAQDTKETPKAKSPEESAPAQTETFRSLAYDTATIQKLYKDAKAKSERRAQQMPEHINTDDLDFVELKPFRVEASDIDFQKRLVDKLSPRPRKRLDRIAAFDPEEANIMMAQVRGDKEFLNGTYDRGGARESGGVVTFDQNQLMKGLDKALEAVRNAMGAKTPEEEKESSTQR